MPKINFSSSAIESTNNKISLGTDLVEKKTDTTSYVSAKAFNEAISPIINDAVSSVLNSVFPIGYVLTTFNSQDYSDYLGFRWEKLENTFLYADGTKAVGEVGGEENHTLNTDEMPWHTHSEYLNCNYGGGTRTIAGQFIIESNSYVSWQSAARNNINFGYAGETSGLGGSQAHNNMPPYTVVCMWRRIA